MDITKHLESFLHQEIPLTRAMQLTVDLFSGDTITLSAPLSPNTNDKMTAFGGSIATLAIITGWSMLKAHCWQYQVETDIVIQNSNIRFLRPIKHALSSSCHVDLSIQIEPLFQQLTQVGKAKITLETAVNNENGVAAQFRGTYALRQQG